VTGKKPLHYSEKRHLNDLSVSKIVQIKVSQGTFNDVSNYGGIAF